MWITTLDDLKELMQHRAQLLIGQPLTKHEHLKIVRWLSAVEDEYGAPPVVVWFGQWSPKEKARGKEKDGCKSSQHEWDHRNVRQRWTGSISSWSQQQW